MASAASRRGGERWWFVAVTLGLACGPAAPGDTTGSTGSATTGGSATAEVTSGASATSTGEATTTSPTSAATADAGATAEVTGTAGASASTGEASTTGECAIDFAQGLCSAACDVFEDCCKCSGQTLLPGATESCAIETGIVDDLCWSVFRLRFDGMPLVEGGDPCGEPDVQWVQYGQDGQRIVELCGEACAAYLAGAFGELTLEMFCEAA
ncbi:hypothetical protein [Nannocystis pusilla]|uniref:Uncharacterized protein n=1 Tax=Nannocystis pusilla TaxID=889268 RepID=A0ABS7TKH1_9BACT|nr:hypothetical protein [Nannocystis pusilla]MBZ5708732.1 hypothetical protein [Nannocystis pusilla]